jgi:hypothetical protein
MIKHKWLSIGGVFLVGAVALILVLRYSEQQTGVLLIPGRTGTFDEGPQLGINLGKGDSNTCRNLRGQLAVAVGDLHSSFDEVRRFADSYNGEMSQIQSFDNTWRPKIVQQKRVIYKIDTCDDFSSQWAQSLATWRDVFRFEKETIANLRLLGAKQGLPESEQRLDTQLTVLRKALTQ